MVHIAAFRRNDSKTFGQLLKLPRNACQDQAEASLKAAVRGPAAERDQTA